MAISRSPSATSAVTQSPKAVSGLRGFIGSLCSQRVTSRTDESQLTQPERESQISEASQLPASYVYDAPTLPPESQEIQAQESQELPSDPPDPPAQSTFIARDFAYQPAPPLLPYTVDEKWVVHTHLPVNPIPGAREREAERWEHENISLFRLSGNRADPPNTIPKTWGGRSKAEDEELMRQAEHELQQRTRAVERRKHTAAALGLTPTEPNLGGPPVVMIQEDFDREGSIRVEAYKRQREAEAIAAGHGPLIKTPTNSPPPPEPRRKGLQLPPPPPHAVTAPLRNTSGNLSKRKLDVPDTSNESDDSKSKKPVEPGRKRQHRRPTYEPADDTKPGPSTPPRYSLRQRHANGTTNGTTESSSKTSPKRKGKGKGKGKGQ